MIPKGPDRGRVEAPLDSRLRSLHEISMELSRAADVSSLCLRAVELCVARLGFDRIGIWFIDPADPTSMVGSWGTDDEGRPRDERGVRFVRSFRHQRDELYAGKIPFVVVRGDVLLDDRSSPVGRGDKAIAPLWDGTRFVGEIVADNLFSDRPIGDEDGEVLVILARTVAHLCSIKRSEAALKEALEAKAVLLEELQHRTKNSFALMRSLVSLEAGRAGSTPLGDALGKLKDRIAVLASLYGQLDAASGLESVRLDSYLRRLAVDLLDGYGAERRGVSLEVRTEILEIDMKRAVPLGLIVNELITDSLKHAFPEGRRGTVVLSLARGEGSAVVLTVSDDGVGLPEGFDLGSSKGFGITLVDMLRNQIGARLEIGKPGRGACFSLSFAL